MQITFFVCVIKVELKGNLNFDFFLNIKLYDKKHLTSLSKII